jgi:hypothetical protein
MKKIIILLMLITVWGCATKIEKTSFLPESRQATCESSIGNDAVKYISWGIGKDNLEAQNDAKKCAVYCCIMLDVTGGCKAMLNPEQKNDPNLKQYLENFFKDNSFNDFVSLTNEDRIDPDKRIKTADGRIKLGVQVVVRYTDLKNELKRAGFIKNFN